MADFDPALRAKDEAARSRAVSGRDDAAQQQAFSRLSPEDQSEARMLRAVEAAVDRRIARIVHQSGPGVSVTGGNGNWTHAIDLSALALSGNAVCNADGTITINLKLK